MFLNSHFQIHTRSRLVSKEEATSLCSKPDHGFVRAEPTEGGYLFVAEYAECPYCGTHITAQECESAGLGNATLRRSEAQRKWPGAVRFTDLDFGALCTAELRSTFEKMPVLPAPYRLIPYTVPFFVDDTSAEGRFGPYCFRYLRNNDEALTVGTELNNCLKTWSSPETPVIAVYRGNHAAAAIEIDPRYGTIEQARIKDNDGIEEDSELLAVFDEWLQTTEFVYVEQKYDDDDDEELPF